MAKMESGDHWVAAGTMPDLEKHSSLHLSLSVHATQLQLQFGVDGVCLCLQRVQVARKFRRNRFQLKYSTFAC